MMLNGLQKRSLGSGLLAFSLAFAPALTALDFNPGGNFAFTSPVSGLGTAVDPIVLTGTMADDSGYIQVRDLDRYGNFAMSSHEDAVWVRLNLLNATSTAWDNFDFELQVHQGQASTNPDGLSFGQGFSSSARPWSSPNYGVFEEFTQERDFINFSGGTIEPNESATMNFIISHNGTAKAVYLLMRPNFAGISPPIPEPGTMALTLLGLAGGFALLRRRGRRG